MKDVTFKANVLFVKHCIAQAHVCWSRKQFRLAETFRNGAREALAELDEAIGSETPVDPELAKKRAIATAYASVIAQGFGRVQ